jgi:hypothetical protein
MFFVVVLEKQKQQQQRSTRPTDDNSKFFEVALGKATVPSVALPQTLYSLTVVHPLCRISLFSSESQYHRQKIVSRI